MVLICTYNSEPFTTIVYMVVYQLAIGLLHGKDKIVSRERICYITGAMRIVFLICLCVYLPSKFRLALSTYPSVCPHLCVYPSAHLSTILKKGASFVPSHPAYNLIDLGRALDMNVILMYSHVAGAWAVRVRTNKSNLCKHTVAQTATIF